MCDEAGASSTISEGDIDRMLLLARSGGCVDSFSRLPWETSWPVSLGMEPCLFFFAPLLLVFEPTNGILLAISKRIHLETGSKNDPTHIAGWRKGSSQW